MPYCYDFPKHSKPRQKDKGTVVQYLPDQLPWPIITLPHNWPLRPTIACCNNTLCCTLFSFFSWCFKFKVQRNTNTGNALFLLMDQWAHYSVSWKYYSSVRVHLWHLTWHFYFYFFAFKTFKISILEAQLCSSTTVITTLFKSSFCNLLKHFLFFCSKLSLY